MDTIAAKVIQWDWGNGEERRDRLEQAGYDYDVVQQRVNELEEEKNWIIRLTGVDKAEFDVLLDEDLPCDQCEVK